MNPRGSTSSPRATRTTPLRKENSYESTRSVHTPPSLHALADFEELSPHFNRVSDLSSFFNDDHRGYRYSDRASDSGDDDEPVHDPLVGKRVSREDRLRVFRQDAMHDFLPATAAFLGEKLMVETESVNDIYYIALTYYQQLEYGRALEILNKKQTIKQSVRCRYLAALCSLALENPRDALDYLGHKNPFSGKELPQDDDGTIKLEACLCYARGKAYFLLKDTENARDCFKEALTVDLKCYDALEALVKYNLMDEGTEWQFVMTLPYEEHCGPDSDYFRYLYGLKLKKNILNVKQSDSEMESLSKSLDVQLNKAESYLDDCRYEECLKICREIKKQDPYFKESISVYVTCLYELGMKIELYEYAQELVERLNEEPVTWHAVGLYNLLIKKTMDARSSFNRALSINQYFQQSWLGFGHTFSAEKDHDQAINAYRTCSKLVPGSYLPYMNMGIQYMEQNQMNIAYEYFMKSLEKNKRDPYLYNELGVYYYKNEMYEKAKSYLQEALKKAKKSQLSKDLVWEKLWCNLGHVYRQPPLRDDDRALKCFENALLRNPDNWDARASTGMLYQLKGQTSLAIVQYQKALSKPESSGLVNELLESALLKNDKYYGPEQIGTQNDAFDISTLYSNQETRDEVDLELDEAYWEKPSEDNTVKLGNAISEAIHTVDHIIIDDGDLPERSMPRWL